MDGFAAIESYGIIGDGESVALVGRDGAIDWWAAPAIDSPPVFAAILDPRDGGCFTLEPTVPYQVKRRYLPGTNVLETTFSTQGGAVQVLDSLNQGANGLLPWAELARDIRPEHGEVPMRWRVVAGTLFHRTRPWARLRDVPILHAGDLMVVLVTEGTGKPERRAIREWVDTHCWSDARHSYIGQAGSDDLDASLLLLARTGFTDGKDPRFTGTIKAIRAELAEGPLLYRFSGSTGGRLRRSIRRRCSPTARCHGPNWPVTSGRSTERCRCGGGWRRGRCSTGPGRGQLRRAMRARSREPSWRARSGSSTRWCGTGTRARPASCGTS